MSLLGLLLLAAVATLLFRLSFKEHQLLARRYGLGFVLNVALSYLWMRLLLHAGLGRILNPLLQGLVALVVLFVADTILSVLLMVPFRNSRWRP